MPPIFLQTTDASSHTLIDDGNANAYADITDLIITNESATATVVSLSDGTVTYKFALAANGGIVANFRKALQASSPTTTWTVQSSAVVTLDFVANYEVRAKGN